MNIIISYIETTCRITIQRRRSVTPPPALSIQTTLLAPWENQWKTQISVFCLKTLLVSVSYELQLLFSDFDENRFDLDEYEQRLKRFEDYLLKKEDE